MKSDFTVARSVISVIEVVGWISVALGFVVVAIGYDRNELLTALSAGVVFAVAGLVQIAVVQIARAQIVTAENSGEMVALLRKMSQGDVPLPTPKIRVQAERREARPRAATSGRRGIVHDRGEVGTLVKRYKGWPIVRESEGFSVDGEGSFPTVIAAEKHIDGTA